MGECLPCLAKPSASNRKPRKFKVIINLDTPLIFTDKWPGKPTKEQVLEKLSCEMHDRKHDVHFHVIIKEVKEVTEPSP